MQNMPEKYLPCCPDLNKSLLTEKFWLFHEVYDTYKDQKQGRMEGKAGNQCLKMNKRADEIKGQR